MGARLLRLARVATCSRPRGLQSRIAFWLRAVVNH
jgi:hypothetical protein